MTQQELDNLRELLLSENGKDVGLEISKSLDDITFNEMLLGRDWSRVLKCEAPVYETYINNRRLILYCYINYNTLQWIEFIYSPGDHRFRFELYTHSHHPNGCMIDCNRWLRSWLVDKILNKILYK